jgi:hypothetical protein
VDGALSLKEYGKSVYLGIANTTSLPVGWSLRISQDC